MQKPAYSPSNSLWLKSIKLWVVVAAIAVVASLYGHFSIGPDTDHIVLLDSSMRLLSGGIPYIDFSDVNAPLIYILYAIPAGIARLTGINAATLLWLFTYGLEAASLTCCYHLLRASGYRTANIIAGLLAIALAHTFISFQHQVFGDRDQLMLTLITPWLLLCSPLVNNGSLPRRTRLATAFLAGLGFALKPLSLLFYLVTIIAQRLQSRPADWRAHGVIAAVFAAYALIIAVFFPAYILEAFPLIWYTYDASSWTFEMRFGSVIAMLSQYWPIMFFSILGTLFPRPNRNKPIIYLFALLATAFLYYLSGPGWYYTQYSIMALCLILGLYATAHMLKSCFVHTGERVPTILIIFALIASIIWALGIQCYTRALGDIRSQTDTHHPLAVAAPEYKSELILDKHLGSASRFLYLGTGVRALSLQKYQRVSVGRYDNLWPLNGMVALRENPLKTYLYNFVWPIFIKGLTLDITVKTPDRIVVDVSPQQIPLPANFSIIPFLKQDEGFATAMEQYQLKEKINNCGPNTQYGCAFEVYYRK